MNAIHRSAAGYPEQTVGHGDFRHLERDIATMADDLGSDLDQLLRQRRQLLVLHFPRQRQRAQEVAEIIGQGIELEPDLVVAELTAGQPRPLDGVLALLDPLFRRATLIVEGNHAFGRAGFSKVSTGLQGSPIRLTAAIGPFARWRLGPTTLCHRLLGRLPGGPLVPAETRLRIDEVYREDWAFVVDYINALPFRRW